MRKSRFTLTVLAFLATFVAISLGEEQAEKLTACQLKNGPAAYNHKLVEVTGFVSHDFEDFTLILIDFCSAWFAIAPLLLRKQFQNGSTHSWCG